MQERLNHPRQLSDFPLYTDSWSTIRKVWVTLTMACITSLFLAFTIFFAYNSSVEQPYWSLFVTQRPERSILILNIASQVTVFCLAELTISVLEAIRWAFASSVSGISGLTFIALSRATNIVGTMYLWAGLGPTPGRIRRDGHKIWAGQR